MVRIRFNILKYRLIELITPVLGLSGCFLVGFALYMASAYYKGDGSYSPYNHFISELGLRSATSMAFFFNDSVIIAGLLMTFFTINLGRFLGASRLTRWATFIGVASTLSFAAVGVFTADDWLPHMISASIFFFGAMISIMLFCLAIWKDKQKRLHPFLIFHGIVVGIWYFIALAWPKDLLLQMVFDPAHFLRPAIWILTILEWGYCFMICSWICMVSVNLLFIYAAEFRRSSPAKVSEGIEVKQ